MKSNSNPVSNFSLISNLVRIAVYVMPFAGAVVGAAIGWPTSIAGQAPVEIQLAGQADPLVAELARITDQSVFVRLAGDNGVESRSLGFDAIQKIKLATRSADQSQPGGRDRLRLIDQSTLTVGQLRVSSDSIAGMLGGTAVQIARRNVDLIALRAAEMDQQMLQQWQDATGQPLGTGDRLFVERDGQLQWLDGIVGEVSESSAKFRLGERNADVGLEKISGFAFYHAAGRELVDPVCQCRLRDGSVLNTRQLQWLPSTDPTNQAGRDLVEVTLVCGDRLSLPRGLIESLDFAAVRETKLSAMQPTSIRWQPLVASPELVDALTQLNQPRFDRAYSGEPLWLFESDEPEDAATAPRLSKQPVRRRVNYADGWAARGGTRIVYTLGGNYRRLQGKVGFADPEGFGNVQLIIRGDRQELISREFAAADGTVNLDLDITGVERLLIEVDYFDGREAGDELHFCEMKVIR